MTEERKERGAERNKSTLPPRFRAGEYIVYGLAVIETAGYFHVIRRFIMHERHEPVGVSVAQRLVKGLDAGNNKLRVV